MRLERSAPTRGGAFGDLGLVVLGPVLALVHLSVCLARFGTGPAIRQACAHFLLIDSGLYPAAQRCS